MLGATASSNLAQDLVRLAQAWKRKAASQATSGLAQSHVAAVSDPESQTTTTSQRHQAAGPKRLKRSYAFWEPVGASNRSNLEHGKLIFSVLHSGIRDDLNNVRRVELRLGVGSTDESPLHKHFADTQAGSWTKD